MDRGFATADREHRALGAPPAEATETWTTLANHMERLIETGDARSNETMETSKTVYFTMVLHPAAGWMRVGNAYPTRKSARDWVPFVRRAWRGLRTKVEPCTLQFHNGVLTDASRRLLDETFNLDA